MYFQQAPAVRGPPGAQAAAQLPGLEPAAAARDPAPAPAQPQLQAHGAPRVPHQVQHQARVRRQPVVLRRRQLIFLRQRQQRLQPRLRV